MNKIPKIIHYCWFGHNPLPKNSIEYIKGWHKKCPDYKIMRWSEKNFDVYNNPFTKKEYLNRNWAFVSDYVRLYALEKFGGIYLDTDVEVLKSLDPLLNNNMFVGLENWDSINSGLICGAHPHNKNISNLLRIYTKIGYKNTKKIPFYYNTIVVLTSYFHKHGFKYMNKEQFVNGCHIYPTTFFCPKLYRSNVLHIGKDTYTIHHYFGSWTNEKHVTKSIMRHVREGYYIKKIIGPTMFRRLYKYYLYIK